MAAHLVLLTTPRLPALFWVCFQIIYPLALFCGFHNIRRIAIVASVLSIIWTWGGARLARRLQKRNTTRIRAANMTRKAIKVGVSLNIVGMFLSLVGAEQIVGMLAVKVLTMQGVLGNPATLAVATQTLQPLDILVVQANTNTMLSHFVSLVCGLYLTKFVDKLDPPSVENDERKRK